MHFGRVRTGACTSGLLRKLVLSFSFLRFCVPFFFFQVEDFGKSVEQSNHFVRGSVKFLCPILMETLTKQDEDPESEDWNAQKAASVCLRLMASLVKVGGYCFVCKM